MIELGLTAANLRVLALGAHPDDIEIGCGGALLRLSARPGSEVWGAVLTGEGERVAEARRALSSFAPGSRLEQGQLTDGRLPAFWNDAKDFLEEVGQRFTPDLVLAPRVDDAHQDHRLVGTLASTVWRDALILHYEIPKWDGDLGAPTHFVPLDDETAHRKVALLHECYPSQASRDWWDDEMFLGLMRLRGMECRHRYAEAFFTDKVVLNLASGPA
jgi:LmbE family N-acetylglucosaminyl deacetylase